MDFRKVYEEFWGLVSFWASLSFKFLWINNDRPYAWEERAGSHQKRLMQPQGRQNFLDMRKLYSIRSSNFERAVVLPLSFRSTTSYFINSFANWENSGKFGIRGGIYVAIERQRYIASKRPCACLRGLQKRRPTIFEILGFELVALLEQQLRYRSVLILYGLR